MTYTNCNIDQHGRCQLAENVILSLHEQKCLHKHLFITRHTYEHTAFLRGVLYTEIRINRSRHDRVLNRTYIDKQPHYEKGGGLSWEGPVTPEQAAPDSTGTAAKAPGDDPARLVQDAFSPLSPPQPSGLFVPSERQ